MSRRFQFSLKTLLWLMLCATCFFGGMAVQKHVDEPAARYTGGYVGESSTRYVERMVLKDGTEWYRELGPYLQE